MDRQFDWRGGFIEAFLILESILRAFWIDASWENRQARHLEAQALQALQVEVDQNLRELASTRDRIVRSQAGVDFFLRSSATDLASTPQDSISSLLSSLSVPWTFRARRAAAEVFSSLPVSPTGASAERHRLLSQLYSEFAGAESRAARVSAAATPIFDQLADRAVLDAAGGLARLDPMVARAGGETFAGLRADRSFLSDVIQMAHWREVYLSGLGYVEETLTALSSSISPGS